jgi:hypothetical protein
MVAWQKIALGRVHAGKTVTIHVESTTSTWPSSVRWDSTIMVRHL